MPAPIPKEVVTEFSRRLYRLMSEQGLSQSDLARKVWGDTEDKRGYMVAKNRDRISQYLHGRGLPDDKNAALIAKALGVEVDDLIQKPLGPAEETLKEVGLSTIAGQPDKVLLTVNKVVPFKVATEILGILATE